MTKVALLVITVVMVGNKVSFGW